MVDDFMVCVDRIIATAACYNRPAEAQTQAQSDGALVVAEQERRSDHHHHHCLLHHHHNRNESSVVNVSNCENGDDEGCSSASAEAAAAALMSKKKVGDNKMVVAECRICQEEDDVLNMEAPCACNGTLKFAHRKCIQRWCNKKGDITCEICNQIFSPNYSLPPARSNPDVMAIDIRQPWGPHIDLRESHLLALAAAERQFLQSEYEDYAAANTSSIACLRSVALILLMVWLMRQVLMATRDSGMVQESSTFFNFQVSLLQFAGFFLPCYVMARSWYVMQSRRRRQGLFGQH